MKTKIRPKISICIPTYEMHGLGDNFLKHSFDILSKQTYKNFNVVISDHSNNDSIEKLCIEYKEFLDIKYYKNTKKRGNSSANLNNAIKKSDGDLIKILFQDDFLFSKKSLEDILENFDLKTDRWLITACEHTKNGTSFIRPFYPKYNKFIHFGKNTISSPSVLVILNKKPLLFNENLIWLMDVDYYKRCYTQFGKPKIINSIGVVNRIGSHQISNTTIGLRLKIKELLYITKKYVLNF